MDAADHLVDVVQAAAEIRVVHRLEHAGDAVALKPQGVVGAVAAGADQRIQAVQQFRVVQQQRVQVEELADLVRQRAVQASAQGVHVGAHAGDRGVQPRQFGVDCGFGDVLLGDLQRMREAHAGTAERAAARCAVALE